MDANGNKEQQRLLAENKSLRQKVEKLKDELVRMVERNLDLTEQVETYTARYGACVKKTMR
ncbi:MAG: hypothetical protein K5683_04485 [Prevotella sp.]|nr:hypothetical protein [Prevotella sp.]